MARHKSLIINQRTSGKTYDGSYFSGTWYGKRILDTFTVSASVIESSNKFANNSLGFIANLNGLPSFGRMGTVGRIQLRAKCANIVVTYTTSYYNYNANLHRDWGEDAVDR